MLIKEDINNLHPRVKKTKIALLEALSELLIKKTVNEITVTEVTEIAKINRSTFYLHFKDTNDLYNYLKTYFLDQMIEIRDDVYFGEEKPDIDTLKQMIIGMLDFVKLHPTLTTALILTNNIPDFRHDVMEIFTMNAPFLVNLDLPVDVYLTYTIAGVLATLGNWIKEDFKTPTEDMCKYLLTLMYSYSDKYKLQ